MAAPKTLRTKPRAPANPDVHAAEDYVDQLLSSEEGNLSPDDVDSMRESVEAIRRGEMTLADFEEKYGF